MEESKNNIKIFMPGRISLLGGLSDLVSPYLSKNNKLIPGCAIASPINLGIYADIEKSKDIDFKMEDKTFNIQMEENRLKEIAQSDSFFSYICGTAYCIKKKYNVDGLKIKITKMDLPIGKGLSSSAAICLLVVRGFNLAYNLNISKEEEKEMAYEGEHIALSNCGRLDQTSILEKEICKIDFLEDKAIATPIYMKKNINLVLVDLNSTKNTEKIMTDLNNCYPFYRSKEQMLVHKMMGQENRKLVESSAKCIEEGDLKKLGENMNLVQKLIDDCSVVCSELKAPKLHQIMNNEKIKELSYGIKGVGSGGDGSAQILAKDKKTQKEIIEYVENKLNLKCYEIDL